MLLVVPDSDTTLALEGLAGRQIVYGYTMHLRTTEPAEVLDLIRSDIETVFCSSDEFFVQQQLKKYNVAYIVIGPDEREFLSRPECNSVLSHLVSSAYQNPKYELLEVNK